MSFFSLTNRQFNSIRFRVKSTSMFLNRYLYPRKGFFSPISLYVESTNRCNGKCFYCFRNVKKPYEERDLSLDTFKIILSRIPSNAVVLEGCAEPLMNPQLPSLIEHATHQGRFTYFTTNGSLLDTHNSKRIIAAELSVLRFSVNSLDPTKSLILKTGISFSEVEKNIKNFNSIKQKYGMRYPLLQSVTVVMKDNFDEIPSIVSRMKSLGVTKIYFNDLVPYNREMGNKKINYSQFQTLRTIERQLNREGILTERCFFRRFEPLRTCILPWQWLNVKLDGTVYPCFQGTVRELSVGNVFEDSFEQIWNGKKMTGLRRDILRGKKTACEICNKYGWNLPGPNKAEDVE